MATWIIQNSKLIGRLAPEVTNYDPGENRSLLYITDGSDSTWKQGGSYDSGNYTPPSNQPPIYTNSSLDILKIAVAGCVDALRQWQRAVNDVSDYYPVDHINKAHDWLAYGHQGVYRVVRSSAFVNSEKTRFCQQTSLGALDITSVHEFLNSASATSLSAPTSAIIWVTPQSGTRVRLNQAESITVPTRAQWYTGELSSETLSSKWWRSLT